MEAQSSTELRAESRCYRPRRFAYRDLAAPLLLLISFSAGTVERPARTHVPLLRLTVQPTTQREEIQRWTQARKNQQIQVRKRGVRHLPLPPRCLAFSAPPTPARKGFWAAAANPPTPGTQKAGCAPKARGAMGIARPLGGPAGLLAFAGFPFRIFSRLKAPAAGFPSQEEKRLCPKWDKVREVLPPRS